MSAYKDCRECYRPMRKPHAPAAEYPGTVQYFARGLCANCYRRLQRTGDIQTLQKKPLPDIDVSATTASLMAYLAWRKPFREKASK